jgi:hypothetical protein
MAHAPERACFVVAVLARLSLLVESKRRKWMIGLAASQMKTHSVGRMLVSGTAGQEAEVQRGC